MRKARGSVRLSQACSAPLCALGVERCPGAEGLCPSPDHLAPLLQQWLWTLTAAPHADCWPQGRTAGPADLTRCLLPSISWLSPHPGSLGTVPGASQPYWYPLGHRHCPDVLRVPVSPAISQAKKQAQSGWAAEGLPPPGPRFWGSLARWELLPVGCSLQVWPPPLPVSLSVPRGSRAGPGGL